MSEQEVIRATYARVFLSKCVYHDKIAVKERCGKLYSSTRN